MGNVNILGDEDTLLSYACEQFEKEAYDKALEAFILAYQKGYERKWILENIYNCYMIGNEKTFRETYMHQAVDAKIVYDECVLDFVPYSDGEYFIFDKEKRIFRGVFSISALQRTKADTVYEGMEYSAVALALDWDFRLESSILTKAQERKIYIVCRDAKRCMSFWKIPELKEYLDNITVFFDYNEFRDYFHKNTSVYLPGIICGSHETSKILEKIREEEHQYRLTPEGRNTENVLLTIAIPTANRGNLLLERLDNLLSMPYDAEIEIAVSKNCTEKYEEEYKQASMITDARLHYYDHAKDLQGYQSFHYAVEMSCGKYVLLVSDEDDVIIGALEHYLKVLENFPEMSIARVKSRNYWDITNREYRKKGLEAFELMFLKQNHISGLMIRRKDFTEDLFLKYPEETLADNIFFQYYPHECWCAALCYRGDALNEPVALISEGKSVNKEGFFPDYASYKARLKQLEGMIDFLHLRMEKDIEGAKAGLVKIIGKIDYLLEMARRLGRDCDDYLNMINQFASICIQAVESFPFTSEQKVELLNFLNYCVVESISLDDKLKKEKNIREGS